MVVDIRLPTLSVAQGDARYLKLDSSNGTSMGDALGANFWLGPGSSAIGLNAIAIGSNSTVAGSVNSVTFGTGNFVTGNYCTAVGHSILAGGVGMINASAFGYACQATFTGSIAVGNAALATADYASAFGVSCQASSNYSTAIGFGTTASQIGQMALGGFNPSTSTPENWLLINPGPLANTPRYLLNTAADDGSTTVQINGSVRLTTDNQKLWFGTGKDSYLTYEGTGSATKPLGLIINSQAVGTGAVYVGNDTTNASPVAGVLSATGGLGTNIAGASLTIRGGAGTGNAAGGSVLFQTSTQGTSGTTLESYATRLTIATGTITAAVSYTAPRIFLTGPGVDTSYIDGNFLVTTGQLTNNYYYGNVVTTNNTQTTLTSIATSDGNLYTFECWIQALMTVDGSNSNVWVLRSSFINRSGVLTQIGNLYKELYLNDTSQDVTMDISGTAFRVRVTGRPTDSVAWNIIYRIMTSPFVIV